MAWIIGALLVGVLLGWLACALCTVSQGEDRAQGRGGAMRRGDGGSAITVNINSRQQMTSSEWDRAMRRYVLPVLLRINRDGNNRCK